MQSNIIQKKNFVKKIFYFVKSFFNFFVAKIKKIIQ